MDKLLVRLLHALYLFIELLDLLVILLHFILSHYQLACLLAHLHLQLLYLIVRHSFSLGILLWNALFSNRVLHCLAVWICNVRLRFCRGNLLLQLLALLTLLNKCLLELRFLLVNVKISFFLVGYLLCQ